VSWRSPPRFCPTWSGTSTSTSTASPTHSSSWSQGRDASAEQRSEVLAGGARQGRPPDVGALPRAAAHRQHAHAQAGATLSDLMARMGHASTRTARIYCTPPRSGDVQVAAAPNRFLPRPDMAQPADDEQAGATADVTGHVAGTTGNSRRGQRRSPRPESASDLGLSGGAVRGIEPALSAWEPAARLVATRENAL